MKELSIEEKAKAYDEAISKAKSKMLYIYQPCFVEIKEIFPELKESKDERIRKWLIYYFKEVCDNVSEKEKKSVIAWLEAQDEQKAWSEEDKKMLKWVIGYLENKMLNAPISEERTACKNAIAWLEKQAQKPNPCDGCVNRKGCINCENGELRETEQKPADKVEPKFHAGEWLCENEPNNYARLIQILEIVNVQGKDRYRISRDIHKDEDVVEFGFVEKYYHNFDIQDAKTGDILHCWIDGYEFILIFNCIKDGYVNAFCHLYNNLDSFSEEPTTMFCRTIQGHFTPATKEQGDLLFAKMKEVGYEWDAEKKELKKIEQKPVKTNEAPEGIYLLPDDRNPNGLSICWYEAPYSTGAIEYIRTNAFIEKACDAYCAICDTKECDGCAECAWVIKFRRQLLKY